MNSFDDLIAPIELIEPVGIGPDSEMLQGAAMKCNMGFVCAVGEVTS